MAQEPSRSKRKQSQSVNLDNLGLDLGHKPPQALDVEEQVLGAMLLESSCVDTGLGELNEKSFYSERNQLIFRAMASLSHDHIPVDILTVTERLKENGDLETVGGAVVLAGLTDRLGSGAHMEYHVRILKQKAIQRELIRVSNEILHDAFDESKKVDELIDEAQSKVYAAVESGTKRDVHDIGTIIDEVQKQLYASQDSTGMSGVPSGFPTLDRITQGWQRSDLIILAARPSVGKTAFALNIARNAAVDHHMPVAFFSLEMSAVQLGKRLVTAESGLSADKIRGAVKLEPYEFEQFEMKIRSLTGAPLYIDDTAGLSLMEFRTKAKNLVHSKGVRLIVVDYLQLMQGPAELRGIREQEVAAISRTLKATAKELDVPIIALSQLSRAAVRRDGAGGKPQLSDLRESGAIEQDADMVLFIHRPDFVGLSENLEDREKTQLIIAKHRNGETRDIDLVFKSERVKFMELNDALDIQAGAYEYASGMNTGFDD
ncbi:MAG: replicative DNA helicase [Bacteroidales bacterium]|nr:replicative DNA helicase [Bacteroidales bacterium]